MSLVVFVLLGVLLGFALRMALPRLSLVPLALVVAPSVVGALVGGVGAALVVKEGVFELHATAIIFALVGSGLTLLVFDALQPAPPPLK